MDLHYQHLYSTTTGNQPELANLLRGEIAINLADGIIFYRKVTDASQEGTDTVASFKLGTFADLSGVEITAPNDGQALVYDSSSSTWKNETLTAASISDFNSKVTDIITEKVTDGTVQAHSAVLDEVAKLDAEGYVYRKADGTFTEMTASGASGEITVTNTPDSGTIQVGLANAGTAGTYTKVTTDAKGRVTSGENPTTLAGYGITDALPLSGGTMTGALKVLDPVEASDAVNKKYADSVALGFVPHEPAKLASTVNVDGVYADGSGGTPGVGATLTLTTSVIDGNELEQDDRVLLVGQTDQKQNGIYTVTAVTTSTSATLTRADDFDGEPTVTYDGLSILVTDGSHSGAVYTLQNRGSITFGTDNITFVETFSPASYTAGDGIDISAGAISVKQGNTVKVVDGNLEVSSGTGNTGKFLQAQGDGQAATWSEVNLSDYVTLSTAQTIAGVKTFSAAPVSTANQTLESDGTELAKLKTVQDEVIYTDSSATGATVAVGGISKGEKISDMTLIEVIDKMLHPYVATTGVGLSITPNNGGTFEVGDTKSLTGGTVRWTAGSTQVTSAEILKAGSPIGTAAVSSGTSVAVTFDAAEEIGATAGSTSYTARVTDTGGKISGGNVTFNFVYPFYHGVVASAGEATGTAIAGMTKIVAAKSNRTIAYTANNQCCVFAYPASYGDLKSIKDANNFEVLSTFVKSTVQVTGLDSTAQQYNVYVNAASTLNAFNFTFNF